MREGLSLTPHLVGGTGIFSDLPTMPADMPLRLEAGTGNEPGCAGLRAALLWAKAHPLDEAALWGQLERLRRDLQQAGANVIDPSGPCTPVVSFVIDGWDCDAVGYVLSSYDIVCRTGLHCAPRIHERLRYNNRGTVRLSLSRFTTDAEVNAVVRAVRDIVRQKPL